ncbi:Complement C1q-like protein 4, partial [Clarias magur]
MRALIFLAFSLYQCTAGHGGDNVPPEVHHGGTDRSLISGIVSDLSEIKSILKDQKALMEERKQGQTSGNNCITELQYELNELKSTVADQKIKLEALQKQLEDKPNVAFSASLFGHGGKTVGGYSTEQILQFQKVFTNVGSAYSPST